jgi:hypothetical protein
MTERPRGFRLSAWEIDVDPCAYCSETAVTVWTDQESEELPRLVPVCPEHAVDKPYVLDLDRARATCDHRQDENSPPCGAAVTHIVLVGFEVEGSAQTGQLVSCRRHAEFPER